MLKAFVLCISHTLLPLNAIHNKVNLLHFKSFKEVEENKINNIKWLMEDEEESKANEKSFSVNLASIEIPSLFFFIFVQYILIVHSFNKESWRSHVSMSLIILFNSVSMQVTNVHSFRLLLSTYSLFFFVILLFFWLLCTHELSYFALS